MTFAIRAIPIAITLAIASLLTASPLVNAATSVTVGDFNKTANLLLRTKSSSWRDSNFGDMGWTHNSGWGGIRAKAGQIVTIKTVASNANLHPAITVWFRGVTDTAPDNYMPDHFYVQNAKQFELGATDEDSGVLVGDIDMNLVSFGFDKDRNIFNFLGKGIKDGVSGQLILKFTAPKTGNYIFVVGGFSPPHISIDSTLFYDVQTTVTRTMPTTTTFALKKPILQKPTVQ